MGYSQEEQVEIVQDAMFFTATIEYEEDELEKVKATRFKSKPIEPQKKVLQIPTVAPVMPEKPRYSIKEHFKETKLVAVICIACWVLGIVLIAIGTAAKIGIVFNIGMFLRWGLFVYLIYFCITYFRSKKKKQVELENSQEYKDLCQKAVDEAKAKEKVLQDETSQKQKEIDEAYNKEKENYENVLVPTYNNELITWESAKKRKIAFLENEISYNKEALENLYNTTKLISNNYRSLECLSWIYNEMSGSSHDFDAALQLFNTERHINATKLVNASVNNLHEGLHKDLGYIYNEIATSNENLEELGEELHKMRRDNNIANAAAAYQRWSTKKSILKEIQKDNK